MKNSSIYFCGFLVLTLLSVNPQASYATSMHHQQMQEISADAQIPELTLSASVDPSSGINLKLLINHYKLGAPGDIESSIYANGKRVLQGHGHLFINGIKIQRIYAEDIHIPQHLLILGENKILVSLNSHRHHNWTVSGETITSTITLTVSNTQQIHIHNPF
ncbi:MAG: hypothetical protein MJK10_21155 [Pseudomonadales bacterium]|nr:hypothetical protein [Pseudomonadales bacterium]NRA18508.1 hypothetical protein [Oceanospirillaceae bacterium]